jgi:3-hydroxyacyl-[acyl-carrier-protein] dehydratase
MKSKIFSLNCVELLDYQPNRYPFLMIDHVTKVKPGHFAEGYKNFTNNEWFFPIHFPGNPNVPGALQLEALAQMLTVAITTLPKNKGKVTHAISHIVKFKKEILPGQKMIIKTKVDSWNRGICKGVGQGFTDGELACEASMTITIPDILKKFLPKK